jgi:hypothetical protein
MNESKELLEATVKGLQEKIQDLETDLRGKERELEDVSKPEMTSEMYEIISEATEEGVGNFDFNDSENYEIDYELDYESRVNAHSIEFNSAHVLTEKIMYEIEKRFKAPYTEE